MAKRKAKRLSRADNIPLHEALDCIARQEGFSGWSLLAAKVATATPCAAAYSAIASFTLRRRGRSLTSCTAIANWIIASERA